MIVTKNKYNRETKLRDMVIHERNSQLSIQTTLLEQSRTEVYNLEQRNKFLEEEKERLEKELKASNRLLDLTLDLAEQIEETTRQEMIKNWRGQNE